MTVRAEGIIGDTSYTVYTLKGDPAEKNVYYVPLTNEEIAAYKKGMEDPESAEGMDAQNRESSRGGMFREPCGRRIRFKRDDASERIRRVRSDSV